MMALALPIFTSTMPVAAVRPLQVFAAGRRSFDVIARAPDDNADWVIGRAFRDLPLEENGWDIGRTKATRVGARHGFPVWRLEQGD